MTTAYRIIPTPTPKKATAIPSYDIKYPSFRGNSYFYSHVTKKYFFYMLATTFLAITVP